MYNVHAHVVTGKLFASVYKKEGVDPNVLSRTMEDCGTLGGTLMPWHTNAVYFTGTLGVLYSQYIPWVLLCYIVPILSLIAAATGYGIWYVDPGNRKTDPERSGTDQQKIITSFRSQRRGASLLPAVFSKEVSRIYGSNGFKLL